MQQELTPEQLVDLPVPAEIQISPDGRLVVFSSSPVAHPKGRCFSSLWIATVGQPNSARQLTAGMNHDRLPRWSSDSSSVAFLSDRASPGKSCAIYLLHLRGDEAHALTDPGNDSNISTFLWSPNGTFIAFTSPDEKSKEQIQCEEDGNDVQVCGTHWFHHRLRLLHVSSRQSDVVFRHERHVEDFAWSQDSRELLFVTHSSPDINAPFDGISVHSFSLARKACHKIVDFPGRLRGPIVWPDDKAYFLAGVVLTAATTSSTLYSVHVSNGHWERATADGEYCMTSLIISGRSIFAKVLEHDLSTSIVSLRDTYSPQVLVNTTREISCCHAVALENEYAVAATVESDPSHPFEILTYTTSISFDVSKTRPTMLGQCENILSTHRFGASQRLTARSFDGAVELDGIFVQPPNRKDARPMPTVVLVHGGPYSRAEDSFNMCYYYWYPYMQLDRDYAILAPNYRGNSGRGEDFAAWARKGAGTYDFDDILALVDAGIKLGYVDKKRVIIGGYSHGGFMAVLAAVRNGCDSQGNELGWRFRAAICGAGGSDMDMLVMTSDFPAFEQELARGAPWNMDKTDLHTRQNSAIWEFRNAADIPPLLLLHGEKDARVPLSQVVPLYRGCLRRGIPCEFAVYPREPHIFEEREHVIDMLRRIKKFCDLHLGL